MLTTMKTRVLTSTTASFELCNEACYYCDEDYTVYLNDQLYIEKSKTNVFSIYGLKPNEIYRVDVVACVSKKKIQTFITTREESVCLNVKYFGAVGDGVHDDTNAIQAAIMACPQQGRVLIEPGTYYVKPLYLKSHMTLELQKNAMLLGNRHRENYPVLPGIGSEDTSCLKSYIGTWEGDPESVFASLITGLQLDDVAIVGEGIVDGNGPQGDWWRDPKRMRIAWRPKLIFLAHCQNVILQGITLQNAPSWTLHPYFTDQLDIIDLKIINPKDSPNTDGIDPESCQQVNIIGVSITVGDDCIAIKSGKIRMGSAFKKPTRFINIRNCYMGFGHGAVVLGSEMAGGIMDLTVSQCLFVEVDRGLRIKTRRGRGENAIIDHIVFENIKMQGVKTPFVINMYYFCDVDGKEEYVWSKKKLPVDDRTPYLGKFIFKDIECKACEVAAGFFYGLPEQKIGCLIFENVSIDFNEDAKEDLPAMMSFIEPVAKMGLYLNEVVEVVLKNVKIEGNIGEPYQMIEVDHLVTFNL